MEKKSKNIILIAAFIFVCQSFFSQKINPNGFNIFRYENDSISAEGFLKQGKPNGYWKNYERNGLLKSEGKRRNYLLDSTWNFYKYGFLKEIVNYENNRKNGEFLEFRDSGIIYSKSIYKKDTLQGERQIYYPTGELQYLYFYLDGNYHGKAYQLDKDSVIISIFNYNKGKLVRREKINRYNASNKKTGNWKTYGSNGILKEEGNYKNGKKDGIFKQYKFNGELKELKKFNMDLLDEDAEELNFVELYKEYYPTGELHFTIAKNDIGKRQGITQEYKKNGEVIITKVFKNDTLFAEGIIDKNGLRQDKWKYFSGGDKIIGKGKYKNDNKIGVWHYFYRTGELEQKGKFIKGKHSGKWVWYYKNKKTHREEYYRRGKEDGEFIEYSVDGKILTKGDYVNGKRDGNWFYQVGDHTEIGKYTEGEKEGEWVYFYDNDQTYFKGKYKNGKPVEKHTYFHYNGKKKWVGTYSLGKKEGKWVRYSEDGQILVTYNFRNNVLIKTDGKRIKPAFKKEIE
ncbi:hypothetical protein N9P38_00580 [Flavobacteriales bacterium]|nr:hypothetical protein [Flavobacteriales bacterium]